MKDKNDTSTIDWVDECKRECLFHREGSLDSRSKPLLYRLCLLRAAKSALHAAKRQRLAGNVALERHQRAVSAQLLAAALRLV